LITEVDDAVGRLVDELVADGVDDNTLILFVSDNGYFQGDRGLADKWYPYEESIRVPLLVRDPRLQVRRRGQVVREIALNIDLAPTILAAAGASVPAVMQGADLAPLYLDHTPPANWRSEFFYEHPTITSRDRIPSSLGIVRLDRKYVLWPEWNTEQFFDLKADPGELSNLANNPVHAAERNDFRRRL
jgi:arylsulfatase A-like enzyme